MKTGLKIILFFLIPILAVIMFPPQTLVGGIPVIVFGIILFSLIGWVLMRGRKWALNFLIFIMGVNVIVRLMIFVAQVVPDEGIFDPWLFVTSLISIALSLWLVLRLDQVDVRNAVVY